MTTFEPGRERGLDPRLARQALLDGVLGQQRRADHHRRVGRVGARGDRRDRRRRRGRARTRCRRRASPSTGLLGRLGRRRPAAAPSAGARAPLALGVRRRVARRERLGRASSYPPSSSSRRLAVVDVVGRARRGTPSLASDERDPVLRALRAGERRHDRRRGRARGARSSAARRRGRARGPAPWRRPRPARPARRRGR